MKSASIIGIVVWALAFASVRAEAGTFWRTARLLFAQAGIVDEASYLHYLEREYVKDRLAYLGHHSPLRWKTIESKFNNETEASRTTLAARNATIHQLRAMFSYELALRLLYAAQKDRRKELGVPLTAIPPFLEFIQFLERENLRGFSGVGHIVVEVGTEAVQAFLSGRLSGPVRKYEAGLTKIIAWIKSRDGVNDLEKAAVITALESAFEAKKARELEAAAKRRESGSDSDRFEKYREQLAKFAAGLLEEPVPNDFRPLEIGIGRVAFRVLPILRQAPLMGPELKERLGRKASRKMDPGQFTHLIHRLEKLNLVRSIILYGTEKKPGLQGHALTSQAVQLLASFPDYRRWIRAKKPKQEPVPTVKLDWKDLPQVRDAVVSSNGELRSKSGTLPTEQEFTLLRFLNRRIPRRIPELQGLMMTADGSEMQRSQVYLVLRSLYEKGYVDRGRSGEGRAGFPFFFLSEAGDAICRWNQSYEQVKGVAEISQSRGSLPEWMIAKIKLGLKSFHAVFHLDDSGQTGQLFIVPISRKRLRVFALSLREANASRDGLTKLFLPFKVESPSSGEFMPIFGSVWQREFINWAIRISPEKTSLEVRDFDAFKGQYHLGGKVTPEVEAFRPLDVPAASCAEMLSRPSDLSILLPFLDRFRFEEDQGVSQEEPGR